MKAPLCTQNQLDWGYLFEIYTEEYLFEIYTGEYLIEIYTEKYLLCVFGVLLFVTIRFKPSLPTKFRH